MPFLELSLPCSQAEQPRFERALEDVGAQALTLRDAHLDAADEQAIFEPGVGELPLWDQLVLTALFPGETDPLLLLAALDAFDPSLDWRRLRLRKVDDADWERAWLDQFQPMRFGTRTWIVPWNHDLPTDANRPDVAVVRLDPGLAFGSGTHPTTALCLDWLDALANEGQLQGATVLDFGCGSGILALAALRLGAARAIAVDNDPQALIATRDNAARNGISARLEAFLPDDAPAARYPLLVANILASALDTLAPRLAAHVQTGGRIAISGILSGQDGALLHRYGVWFDALFIARRDDWIRIDGVRNGQRVVE